MYAVIATGGKQYRVAKGDVILIEKLDIAEGASVNFDNVLLINDEGNITIGGPYIEGSSVTGTIKTHGRRKKIEVVKFQRRKQHHTRKGHRQAYTEVEITDVNG
jgi:large subunit ribosomal protein L21